MSSQNCISVSVLGRFEIADPQGSSLLPKGRKTQGILAYIASQRGKPTRRTQLIDLFWSDRAEAQGKASLRQSLHELRASLGGHADNLLTIDRQTVRVVSEHVKYDLWGQDGTIRSFRAGEFLHGLDPIAPVFDEWLDGQRREIFSDQVALAERELARATLGEDLDAILRAARHVLRLDPCSEAAAKEAMKVHSRRNQRSQVLQVYSELCRSLEADEFTVSASTRQLYEKLRGGSGGEMVITAERSTVVSPTLPVGPTRGTPIISIPAFSLRANNAGDTELCETLAEDFIARIALMPELGVQSPVNPDGADYVLLGSLSRQADLYRCNIRITHRSSGIAVWSDRRQLSFQNQGDDISDMVDDMVAPIVAAIEKNEHALRVTKGYVPLTAYDHHILAKRLFFTAGDPSYALKVRDLLEHALELDPLFEPSYELLVQNLNTAAFFTRIGIDLTEGRARAAALADRLVAINSRHPHAHVVMAWCHIWRRNFSAAERSIEDAIELGPYEPHRLNAIGTALVFLGRLDDGEDFYNAARRKMCNNLDYQRTDMGELYYLKRDFERALSWLEHAEERGRFRTLFWRSATYAQLGRLAEARQDVLDLEEEFERRWCGPNPYEMHDGVKWYLNFKVLKRDIDRDILLDGLAKAGVEAEFDTI